jgi:hypothetical protein
MWFNVSDERFMNWVRIASMSNFRKLWGRIESTLSAGRYTVMINNCNNILISKITISQNWERRSISFCLNQIFLDQRMISLQ